MVAAKRVLLSLVALIASFAAGQGTVQKVPGAQWATGDKVNPNWTVAGHGQELGMYYYAPPNLPPNSPLVVALHYCGGSASLYSRTTNFIPAANENKFAVIYPEAPSWHDNKCWQVNSTSTLTRGGLGDSDGIMKMVSHTMKKHNSDPKRVFVLGSSSGGMMTNVMMATYPDVFAAAASFSGIPYGCVAGSRGASPSSDSSPCTKGGVTKTGAAWAAQVKSAYPGYTGAYPRVQIWHQTGDPIVRFALQAEQVKQWTAVHGISGTETSVKPDTPKAGTKMHVYGEGDKVVAFETSGLGHPHPVNIREVLKWFGITKGA